jgi:hypothetical protein
MDDACPTFEKAWKSASIENSQICYQIWIQCEAFMPTPEQGRVSHCGLAIFIKKYL